MENECNKTQCAFTFDVFVSSMYLFKMRADMSVMNNLLFILHFLARNSRKTNPDAI